jgi:hypothetical protein
MNMKNLLGLALVAGLCSITQARPIVIEQTSVIETPDPDFYFGWRVGIDGDDAVVYGTKTIPDPFGNDDTLTRAFLFHRNGTTWSLVCALADKLDDNEGDGANSKGIDMRNGVIAASMQPLHIFERVNGSYVERTDPNASPGERRGDYYRCASRTRSSCDGGAAGRSSSSVPCRSPSRPASGTQCVDLCAGRDDP